MRRRSQEEKKMQSSCSGMNEHRGSPGKRPRPAFPMKARKRCRPLTRTLLNCIWYTHSHYSLSGQRRILQDALLQRFKALISGFIRSIERLRSVPTIKHRK